MKPQPGDFLVTAMPGDVGAAVRLGQFLLRGDRSAAKWAHAAIVSSPVRADGTVTAVAALPGGVAYRRYRVADCLFSHCELSFEQRGEVLRAAGREAGRSTDYSFVDYLALAAHRFRLPGSRLLKDYVATSRHMICSQLVDWCYEMAGVELFRDGRWPGYVIPADLAGLCGG